MKTRPWWIVATVLLLAVVAMLGLWLTRPQSASAESERIITRRPIPIPSPTPDSSAQIPAAAASVPYSGAPLTLEDAGTTGTFEPALDELVRRQPDGSEETVSLPTHSNFATLRDTAAILAKREPGTLLPIFYEADAPRNATTRRIVTPEIRVELAADATLPFTIPDSVEITRPDYAPNFAVIRFPDSFTALDRLEFVRGLPGVRRADVLLARQQTRRALPNDPLVNSQWHLKNTGQSGGSVGADINVESVWNYPGSGYRGSGIIVGVVDDGLETTHPDLAANVRTDIDHDWNDGTPDDPSPGSADDHGTSCAGNVAAIGNNNLGVAGSAPESKIVGLRLIAASTTDNQEAEAMAWRNDVIQIKSNSWGPNDDGRTLEAPGSLTNAAFENSVATGRNNRGTIHLWAGGNGLQDSDNSNNDGYANSIYTIAIGATTNQNAQAYYSEPGANLVVVAPSSGGTLDITTVDRSGSAGYNTSSGTAGNYADDFGGTSSATPTVAGVVALMLQRNPNLGWRDVQEILIQSAAKIKPSDSDWITNSAGYHFNHKFGAGLVDASAAVAAAAIWTNLATATTAVSTQSNTTSIPDNNATGITRTFDLGSSNLRVEHVTVRVNINHTSRGNLAITLTSPSGVQSRLTELHTDSGNNYSDWTFMTVRNWGENSAGTWSLKIADRSTSGNSTGGTLTAAELTVHGATAAPVNPAPVVQLTAPDDQAVFSPGAAIELTATATDLTIGGQPGVVTSVEFLVNGSPVSSDSSAPYSVSYTPPTNGTYTLQARATDSEGAVGNSGTRSITVTNQPPVITAAALTPADQGFSDIPLVVTGLVASDPEGTSVSIAYQWQSSTDGVNFTNATGSTTASIDPTAGRTWRCVLTPSDGVNFGDPFTTPATMILTRPPTSIVSGESYTYTSDLVLRGTSASFSRDAIINEFSQGPSGGTSEWVEILTLTSGSLRQWKFDDATVDNSVVNFANSAVWDNVPAGTLLVIYNGSSKDPKLPTDDFDSTDGRLVIASNNSTYFTGSWPSLSNSGDGLVIKDSTGTAVHSIAYSSNFTFTPNIGSVGSNTAAAFTGNTETSAATASGWRTNSSTTNGSTTVAGVTPSAGNTTDNATFVDNLRTGVFNQPAFFRIASGTTLPAELTLDAATGQLSGPVTAAPGTYPVTIERFNSLGETASFTFDLTVTASTESYAQWLNRYPTLSDPAVTADPDGDSRSNLLEYAQGTDPQQLDGAAAITFERTATDAQLHFQQSKTLTGVTVTVESSPDLKAWSSAGVTYDPDDATGPNLQRTARAPLTDPATFLRLKVTQTD